MVAFRDRCRREGYWDQGKKGREGYLTCNDIGPRFINLGFTQYNKLDLKCHYCGDAARIRLYIYVVFFGFIYLFIFYYYSFFFSFEICMAESLPSNAKWDAKQSEENVVFPYFEWDVIKRRAIDLLFLGLFNHISSSFCFSLVSIQITSRSLKVHMILSLLRISWLINTAA